MSRGRLCLCTIRLNRIASPHLPREICVVKPHSHTACTILFDEKAAHARLRISRHNCERGIAYSEVKNESEGSLSYFWRGSVPGNVSAYRADDRSPHQQAVDW